MLNMRFLNKTLALLVVILFVISFSIAGNSVAIPQSTLSTSEDRSALTNLHPIDRSVISDQGTNVNWYTDTGSNNNTWTWSNNNWMFGPQANYELLFNNGTQIDKLDFIPLAEEITWRINIPTSILRGAGLQSVYVNGMLITPPNSNFSASFNFNFYNGTPLSWSSWSNTENRTSLYSAPFDVSINTTGCIFTSDPTMYVVAFKVTFGIDTPVGLYNLYASINDDEGNSYNVQSRSSTNDMMSNNIAIGIPISEAYSYAFQGGYTLEKQDLFGDTIYSVSRNTDFMMRINITGSSDLAYVALWTMFFGQMQVPVIQTGQHTEMVTKLGGWEYDPTIDTYFYNVSAEYTVPETVWGEYTTYDTYNFGSDRRHYNSSYAELNSTDYSYSIVTYENENDMRLMYIYNFTTLAFELVYGFTYLTYPLEFYQPGVNQEMVWYTEPIENAQFQIYELNETLSTTYTTSGVISVEFIGHFTDEAQKGAVIQFQEQVRNNEGYDYYPSAGDYSNSLMTSDDYTAAKQVAVETPVTIAKLLSVDDSPLYSWFFPADPGTAFEVLGRLQGGADLSSDIDGAIFEMKSYESFWADDVYGYTDMYYEILVGADESVTLTSYNYTAKQNKTWGYHWEWGESIVTGWHYEYNETTGNTVWVYGDYLTYTNTLVEGWYYEWYYYNQKDSKWVSSADWYYYGIKSEMSKTDVVFAEVSNISTYINGGDLYYSFLVNLTDSVREITHYWDFKFANNTWVQDPSSGIGFHDVGVWRPGWVYSFDYMGKDLYVDISSQIGVYNSSIPGIDDWLVVKEMPFITLDGVDYPIRVRDIMYPYSTYTEERILFYDNLGYFYELLNGSKIYVESERKARIYNVTIPGHGSFTSAQKEYINYYDGTDSWYSWWDIDGNLHQGTNYSMWSSNAVVEFIESSDAEYAGYYIRIGAWDKLQIQEYPRYDPRTGTEYVLSMNGTRYDLTYDYYYGGYEIYYNATYQHASWVMQSLNASYLGSPVFVAESYIMQEQWFTTEDHYEMPYPGALADWQGVYYTTSDYNGMVKTTKTIAIGNKTYIVRGNPDTSYWNEYDYNNHTGFWVMIGTDNYTLDAKKMWLAIVNGTYSWQPSVIGGTLDYGTLDGLILDFEGQIITPNQNYLSWYNNMTYGYEYGWYIDFYNGTIITCEPRTLFEVYLVDANGVQVYTLNKYPIQEYVSEFEYNYYIEDLNGSRHYVDSYRQLPALDVIIAEGWNVWGINGTSTLHYIVNSTEYIASGMYMPCGVNAMVFTNSSYAGKYFFRSASHDNILYNVTYEGIAYNVTAHQDYIFQTGSMEGQEYVYKLAPINSVTFKNFNEIIVGNPRWALWGMRSWDVSETTNALDLDGDASTTDDQYYVLSEYQSTNNYNTTWSRMWVNLQWDPNGTLYGDEMNTYSWMGIETNTWSYEWQNTYYWYHANNLTLVSAAEWATINATIFDEEGLPRAGYWDLSYMARNVTWADTLAEAEANGWDWYDQAEQTWTWLSFGIGQNYGVDSVTGWSSINLRYEYSGLMLWTDEDNDTILDAYMNSPGDGELTHYFIPDSVGDVSFVTPGVAYGNHNTSGSILLEIDDEVTWGVTFEDVNGTTFPFNTYAYWDWYGGVVTGSDLRTFDERPTKVTIDEISFLVHYQGHINTTEGATSNYATMKVDNTIGQWYINGQAGHSDLVNRSLALNYLADVSTSEFRTVNTTVTQEQTIVSDRFEIGDSSARFAEMIMGGTTYDWAYDPYHAYNVTSQTTRASSFSSAYQSESGKSATSWTFSNTQYYVSIGFPYWNGFYVYQDPVFVGYVSSSGQSGESGIEFNSFSINPTVPSASDSVTIGVDIYTDINIQSANLVYSTDGINFDANSPMSRDSVVFTHWTGTIPPFAEDTQIWYKVILNTEAGTFESAMQSYIVGQGVVIITTTLPTTTPGYTGPITGPPLELVMMVGGVGFVIVLLGVMAKRRK